MEFSFVERDESNFDVILGDSRSRILRTKHEAYHKLLRKCIALMVGMMPKNILRSWEDNNANRAIQDEKFLNYFHRKNRILKFLGNGDRTLNILFYGAGWWKHQSFAGGEGGGSSLNEKLEKGLFEGGFK